MENSELLMYLFKVAGIQGIFFLLYYLFLRTKTSYQLNRGYLLFTLIISFVIPFINIPITQESIKVPIVDSQTFEWGNVSEVPDAQEIVLENNSTQPVQSAKTLDFGQMILWIYVSLAVALVARSIIHLFILQKLKKQSQYVEKRWFKLFKTAQVHPFSFLSNVFIPKRIFGTDSFRQILEHECEHVRQRHSIDRLLIDFMAALFWFNPFIYLYRRALIEIHEYQADAAVIAKFPNSIEYQEILFSQLKATPYSGLVSHFNFSTIKKRIVMINKQNNRKSTWSYLLAIPVTLFVILAFANKRVEQIPVVHETEESELIETVEIEEATPVEPVAVHEQKASYKISELISGQNDFVPSILPLKETGKMKVTSGFGMRLDPIDKKRKMHKGLDLRTPIGSVVISTADGVVHNADFDDKYGYFILIDHGGEYMTRYSQLSKLNVKKGDKVSKTQEIGLSGNSGRSTGPHLHYEVVEVGVGHKNPMNFIKNYKFSAAVLDQQRAKDDERNRIEIERRLAEEQAILKVEEARFQELLAMEKQAFEMEKQRELEALEQAKEIEQRMLAEKAEYEAMRQKQQQPFLDIKRITDDPIYILDGNEISRDKSHELNPDDIESVEVLKGNSALKKYGDKAKGGVVIIETKKDSKKKKDKEKDRSKSKNQDGFSQNNRGLFKALFDASNRVAVKMKTQNQERLRRNAIKKLIDSKKFALNASFLQGRNGNRVVVFSDNYMMIDDDNFTFQTALPNEIGINGIGGMTATGFITSHELKTDEKNGSIMARYEVNSNQLGQGTITFKINGSGHESATFVNHQGQLITMIGSIESPAEGLYKGISRFD